MSGAPEYQFADVVAAVRLSNGDIVVADRGASELRSYDAAGNFQWRAGRFGEGPGEFQSLEFLGTTAGDTLVTFDNSLVRVQVFGPQGGLARTLRVAITEGEAADQAAVADKAIGVVDGLLIVRFVEYGDVMPTGIVRWPLERLAALDLADGAGLVADGAAGPRSACARPGGRALFARVVCLLEGAGFRRRGRISRRDRHGSLVGTPGLPRDGAITAVVRRDMAPREVTAALLDLHLDGIVEIAFPDPAAAAPEDVAGLRRMWRNMPRGPTLPVLRSLHVDATGHLWLQPYYVAGAEPPPFEIHSPDGIWLGSVSLPPGRQRAFVQYQAPYMEIGEDYVLGVWTDDLDVQYVRMYRINK